MNWYVPITIIPGLGMLILSTVTQILSLSGEINSLVSQKCSAFQHEVSKRKIKQLAWAFNTRQRFTLYSNGQLCIIGYSRCSF